MKILLLLLSGCLSALCVSASAADIKFPGGKDEAADLSQQADTKLQSGPAKTNYQAAAALLLKATKLDPDNMDIQLKLGWVYQDKLHDPQSAYPYLAVVVKRQPNNVDARKLLALACSQTGRLREAVAEFQEASRLRPDDLWIQANLGRSLARLGEYRKASEIYAEILKKDPTNPDARLGQAELAAWRGHSGSALETLDQLVKENPTNVDALILRGDVHRWGWDLTDAQADYQQALTVAPDDYEASTGLTEAEKMSLSDVTLKAYQFKDSANFFREYGEVGTRVHLTDRAYLVARADSWQFTNPGFDAIYRVDGAAGMEYDFARFLQTTLEGDVFDYQHREAFFGGQLSTKLSPMTGFDIYTVLAYNQPFISSMNTVSNELKQSSIGNGLDINIGEGFSFQNSLNLARVSDKNTYWEEKPQLSYKVFGRPLIFLRAEYDYLHYSDANTNYWTPSHWQYVAPVLDVSIPLGKFIHLNGNARSPYVFDASKFGILIEGGPVVDIGSRLQLGGSYTYASIPGDPHTSVYRPPWSGQGWQAFLRLRF